MCFKNYLTPALFPDRAEDRLWQGEGVLLEYYYVFRKVRNSRI
jgi:hypothetical protein